jgi:hypothetical protein
MQVRLHISPLTEELLPKVIGASLPFASNVSFHSIATFPERSYGFLDLPTMEAEKVKKKLNGTILKGQKVKVEEARKDKRKDIISQSQELPEDSKPKVRKSERKRKREDGVISGIELPEGRKVKRGWTESVAQTKELKSRKKQDRKDKKRPKTSSYTDQSECLFQTNAPASTETKETKRSSKNRTKDGKKKLVIHEFENTTKHPSFIRDSASKSKKVKGFDEEKGWVDEEDKVIEPAPEQQMKRTTRRQTNPVEAQEPIDEAHEAKEMEEEETSSSGTSGESEDDSDSSEDNAPTPSPLPPGLEVTQPSPVTSHPLESLFKRPKPPTSDSISKPNLEVNTSFTFFGEDAEDPVAKSLETPGLPKTRRGRLPNLSIPITPYTQRDASWRGQRSAAPTPDTAAPGKSGFGDIFGKFSNDRKDDIEEEDEEMEQTAKEELAPVEEEAKEEQESEFSKEFWENRGNNDRAWKKRRRETAKEQRRRDNRKRKAI